MFLCFNFVQLIFSNSINTEKPKPKPNMEKSKFVNFGKYKNY